jgi:hypothetical protein
VAGNYGKVGKVYEECVSMLTRRLRGCTDCTSNRVEDLAEMAAIGLGLPKETFKEAGKYG